MFFRREGATGFVIEPPPVEASGVIEQPAGKRQAQSQGVTGHIILRA